MKRAKWNSLGGSLRVSNFNVGGGWGVGGGFKVVG